MFAKSVLKTCLLLLTPLLLVSSACGAEKAEPRANPAAIPFEPSLPWLNVSRSLSLKDLRGKVVILDFWTYGCINCIHVLEDFRKLEHKYGNKVVVIGIHTPKFDNEKNLDTLRRIVVRYGIEHPVVNDIDSIMGLQYGMRAWPTQYVIDPLGKVLGKLEGEGNLDLFIRVIDQLLDKHAEDMSDHELPIALEKQRFSDSLLAAPGKIAVSSNSVAISDTLHHRIILADRQGKITRIIGGKESGYKNGSANDARFLSPQGLAFADNGLYVADTGNHSIRFIDFGNDEVTTVAGNGTNESNRGGRKYKATSIGLRSPWALALKNNQLYIAMAGNHQIWRLDIDENRIFAWAGSGRETIDDGPLELAGFSQPSGLSLIGDKLYVADAEDSGVRVIDIKNKRVTTLVGSGLFDFGDVDGDFEKAQLQHVLGIATNDLNEVYIADTYNHKLKLLKLKEKNVSTVAGTGKPEKSAGAAQLSALNEPGGIAFLDKNILVADTNNNRIMQYNPASDTLAEWPLTE
jgi:thiol-disulfide isomerase/thioredoxin/DNA-binding beta-propeller fold protein YncE